MEVNVKKLLTLFFVLCFSIQLISADMVWTSPTTLSTASTDASEGRIVIDSGGNATSVWVEGGFVKASSLPFGGSWSSLSTLSGSGSSLPRLKVDGSGNVTAIWLEGGVVKSATLPFGGSWSAATALSDTGATATKLVVDTTGNAVAAWVRGGFVEAIQKPFGGSWGTVSMLSGADSDNPDVAIGGDGTIVAMWHSIVTSADAIQSSTGSVGGSWGATKNVFQGLTAALNHNLPKVAVDNDGNASTLWFRSNGSGPSARNVSVFAAELPKDATAWSQPAQISVTGVRDPTTLEIRMGFDENGNAIALWLSSYDGRTFNVETTIKHAGQSTWIQPVRLAIENIYAFDADLAINSFGNALAGYMYFDGSALTIQSLETNFSGFLENSWSIPLTPSQGTNNAFPRVATSFIGDTINAAAVWIQFDGTNTTLQAVSGTRTLLAPPSNLAVMQSTNDFGVFQDHTNTITWDASTDPNVVAYNIYRNGVPIGGVASDTLEFVDNNRGVGEAVTYGVSSITVEAEQSRIVTVSVP